MDWFFIWLRNKMREAHDKRLIVRSDTVVAQASVSAKAGHKRVELLSAINGKILEIAHRKSPQHDWEVSLYIVKDDEALADAIATALLVTGEN